MFVISVAHIHLSALSRNYTDEPLLQKPTLGANQFFILFYMFLNFFPALISLFPSLGRIVIRSCSKGYIPSFLLLFLEMYTSYTKRTLN